MYTLAIAIYVASYVSVIIPLQFLQISDLHTVPTRFYESLNAKIRCVNYMHFFPNPVTHVRICICTYIQLAVNQIVY